LRNHGRLQAATRAPTPPPTGRNQADVNSAASRRSPAGWKPALKSIKAAASQQERFYFLEEHSKAEPIRSDRSANIQLSGSTSSH